MCETLFQWFIKKKKKFWTEYASLSISIDIF